MKILQHLFIGHYIIVTEIHSASATQVVVEAEVVDLISIAKRFDKICQSCIDFLVFLKSLKARGEEESSARPRLDPF